MLEKSIQENSSLDLVTLDAGELEKDAPLRGAKLWSCFRKDFQLEQVPTRAVVRIVKDALTRTKERFREMTDHHYTTLFQGWGIGKNGFGGGTSNHA